VTRSIVDEIEDVSPRGIAATIARLITSGELAPGDRLPTVRSLAADLGVSPGTVSTAWQTLAAVGLLTSHGRSGSFVRESPRAWMPHRYRRLDGTAPARLDLSRGTPDPALLPDLEPAFLRISGRLAGRAATASYHQKPDIPELHDLLRDSWPAPVESLTVVNGALDGIDRALGSIVHYGDRIAVENPVFAPFIDLIDQYGLTPVPFALDAEGPEPTSFAQALQRGPRVVLLQPRAQNPTGISMTLQRAEHLAAILGRVSAAADAIVIEDDHSWAIAQAPGVSLARWMPDRVLHVRSFSKSHGPDLRIGALGGPRPLVDRIVARRLLGPGWTSRMLQAVLYELLSQPDAQAQVTRARRTYADRQLEFTTALQTRGRILPPGDGINAWVPVDSERDAMVRLAAGGILVAAGSPFRLDPAYPPHVRVSIGAAPGAAAELANLLFP
jgi:DNA-binding transcriptional MocR family regulator